MGMGILEKWNKKRMSHKENKNTKS